MKFLKRKPQRDESPQYSGHAATTTTTTPRPPSPVSKDLPSTPLYARYARMTTSSSLDSPAGGLGNPSLSRFGATNGSNASGFFANPDTSSTSADTHNDGSKSHGKASGSALLEGRPSSSSKPEPIKLKTRRPRTATDDNTRVASMVLEDSKSLASTRRLPSESVEHPASSSRAKESLGDIWAGSNQDDGINTFHDPSPGAKLSHSSLSSHSATPSHSAALNQATNANAPSNVAPPRRSSTAPIASNGPPSNGVESGRVIPQNAAYATNEDNADLYSFYNAAVRLADAPRAPSPAPSAPSPIRPKEGPPISIRNRSTPNKTVFGTNKSIPPPLSLQDQSQNSDILVKPPSRRESLQAAARVPLDSATPPMSPALSLQRSPSPAKTRTVVTSNSKVLDDPEEPQSGFAGVGAFTGPNARGAASPPSTPVNANRPSTPTSPPVLNSKITRVPGSFNSTASSGSSSRLTEGSATPIAAFKSLAGENLSRARSPQIEVMARSATPPGVQSSNSTPKASNIPIPSSGASSASTPRQSRLGQAPLSPTSPQSTPTGSGAATPVRSSRSTLPASIPVSDLPVKKPRHQPQVKESTDAPSRQSSSASAISSSPSATRTQSTANSTNGLLTPEETPMVMTTEPAEISKITLKKRSTKINGVTYTRDQSSVPQTNSVITQGQEQPRGNEDTRNSHQVPSPHQSQRQRQDDAVIDQNRESPRNMLRYQSAEANTSILQSSGRHQTRDTIQPSVHPQNTSVNPSGMTSDSHIAQKRRIPHFNPQDDHIRDSRYDIRDFDPDLVYPIENHLANPDLLARLLLYLQFTEWLPLASMSKTVRNILEDSRDLREEVLERYLGTVGYNRWDFGKKREPLVLTLRDLNSYLRGVSIPIHRYSEIAEGQASSAKEGKSRIVRLLASSTRAYSKVVLRLRAQAEAEASEPQGMPQAGRPISSLMRAQSPSPATGRWQQTFHSPLYRIGHAPLLRVFVPSPDGPWLSDPSVLACEKELKRAGILPLMKTGDVVWDTAVSDEAGFGNVGKLVWDGNYLIDLDYTFGTTGDIPPYLHSLSFPPAYFHKVLRSSGNPIMQIDLRPWGKEIASNIQLVQDRAQAETPQGGRHSIMRWVHRTRFQVIRDTPIPDTNLFVDAGWEGFIVVETEGTNEGLADLQLRCGMEWFKPQPGVQPKQGDGGRVYRLLRERSRPGEIWMRTVRMKERIS